MYIYTRMYKYYRSPDTPLLQALCASGWPHHSAGSGPGSLMPRSIVTSPRRRWVARHPRSPPLPSTPVPSSVSPGWGSGWALPYVRCPEPTGAPREAATHSRESSGSHRLQPPSSATAFFQRSREEGAMPKPTQQQLQVWEAPSHPAEAPARAGTSPGDGMPTPGSGRRDCRRLRHSSPALTPAPGATPAAGTQAVNGIRVLQSTLLPLMPGTLGD